MQPDSPLPLIGVIGPTASGKTDLGAFLARELGGEIVSADAKQVYRGMDIGTAKETDLDVPQHLIDIKEPGERITVAEYQLLAYAAIDALHGRGKVPVLVGGSGLYAEAVLHGYVFAESGKSQEQRPRYRSLKMGLAWERKDLVARAEKRLRQRLEGGLIDEVDGLLRRGIDPAWLHACGIEYRYVSLYLLGKLTYADMEERTAAATRQFIKRQYTWWRRHADVNWVSGNEEALSLARSFLSL